MSGILESPILEVVSVRSDVVMDGHTIAGSVMRNERLANATISSLTDADGSALDNFVAAIGSNQQSPSIDGAAGLWQATIGCERLATGDTMTDGKLQPIVNERHGSAPEENAIPEQTEQPTQQSESGASAPPKHRAMPGGKPMFRG
jgi:hypothetical protein